MRKLEFIIILLLLLGSLWGQSSDIDAILQKAKSGDAESQYDLAMCYQYGEGLPQDLKEAARWFLLAAEQGYGNAQISMGELYALGGRRGARL